MKPIRLFECYAGYGGVCFGFKIANIPFECVGYSEYEPKQIKIYELNHKGHKNYGDITLINPHELPDFDLITGGFPCQDVSIAGLRDLSIGRTKTVLNMLEIIKVKKPKYCLLENVEGILSIENGELFKEIIRILKSFGYAVSYKLLYSKDYGTPQTRPRVWIACELGRDSFCFNPFPPKEELKLKVSDLLEKEVDEKYYKSQKFMDWWKTRFEETTFVHLINNLNIANTLTASNSYHDNNLLIHGSQAIDTSNSKFIIENKDKFRSLTPKECFRLMGFFNDEINLDGIPKSNAYFSAGNGWDVNLVSKIFKKWFENVKDL